MTDRASTSSGIGSGILRRNGWVLPVILTRRRRPVQCNSTAFLAHDKMRGRTRDHDRVYTKSSLDLGFTGQRLKPGHDFIRSDRQITITPFEMRSYVLIRQRRDFPVEFTEEPPGRDAGPIGR